MKVHTALKIEVAYYLFKYHSFCRRLFNNFKWLSLREFNEIVKLCVYAQLPQYASFHGPY